MTEAFIRQDEVFQETLEKSLRVWYYPRISQENTFQILTCYFSEGKGILESGKITLVVKQLELIKVDFAPENLGRVRVVTFKLCNEFFVLW